MVDLTGQDIVIRSHVTESLALQPCRCCQFDTARQDPHDRLGDLVLQVEDIDQLAVVPLGPGVVAVCGID